MKKHLKYIVLTCLSLCCTQVHADDLTQSKALDVLLTTKSIQTLDFDDINVKECSFEDSLSTKAGGDELLSKGYQFITYTVMINVFNGYTFHIADYFGDWGNSRIITCLDGECKGLQGIADNGVLVIQSNEVTWHKNYFEHNYPGARVYSYTNKQIFETK